MKRKYTGTTSSSKYVRMCKDMKTSARLNIQYRLRSTWESVGGANWSGSSITRTLVSTDLHTKHTHTQILTRRVRLLTRAHNDVAYAHSQLVPPPPPPPPHHHTLEQYCTSVITCPVKWLAASCNKFVPSFP